MPSSPFLQVSMPLKSLPAFVHFLVTSDTRPLLTLSRVDSYCMIVCRGAYLATLEVELSQYVWK
jgi:hypothetical protein